MPVVRVALALLLLAALAGCEMLGLESTEKLAAQKDADGKAIGGACRHASRALEDCFALNPKAPKASVFAGWREMDEYMREHKIEGVAPAAVAEGAKSASLASTSGDGEVQPRPAGERRTASPTGGKAAHPS